METTVGPSFNNKLNVSNCINCGQCIMVCPTGALHEKDNISQVMEALQNPEKHVVVQISQTVSISLAEEFGAKTGKEMNAIGTSQTSIIATIANTPSPPKNKALIDAPSA
jgi:NADH dehydrogenase/NADH:ubiquinone oxidoreductase subunit G